MQDPFWQGFFSVCRPGVIMGILITFTVWGLTCTWPLWWPERKK